jgi:hypothetical protein
MTLYYIHSRGNSDPAFNLIVLVVIIAVVFISLYFSRKATVHRNLRNTDGKKIASFADGEKGKISGSIVFAGETLIAPISGRRCSYYYVIIEEYHSFSMGSKWRQLFEEENKADVVLFDGTGYAIVDTRAALAHLVMDAHLEPGSFKELTPELKAYLSRVKVDTKGLFGINKTLRYFEGVLEKGERCAVSGIGQWNLSADHKIKIPSKDVLVITIDEGETEKVYISDDPEVVEA